MSDDERLRKVLEGERRGGGQISVSGLGERATPQALSWLDTDAGRYLIHTSDDDGQFVARYEPAGHGDLVRALQNAVAHVY